MSDPIQDFINLNATHERDKQNVEYLLRKLKELSRMTTKVYITASKHVDSQKSKSILHR